MNEEEKKVEKQEQLFDLGNGRFVDVNKLIQVAQQENNQDIYTSSWSLGSRRNAIKNSINETLQAIKDGVVTGRNANKTYNFNKDILQQTGKHFDPNSAALDYLNWIFDSEQAPADFYTQPKEEPKKEGPKKYTGSYEQALTSLFPSMEVWNTSDADDATRLISTNTNRIAQAKEVAKKHLASSRGYDFSESIYQNEQAFEEAMNAIINAGNMDALITAMARTGGFKGVDSIQDTYFGIPKQDPPKQRTQAEIDAEKDDADWREYVTTRFRMPIEHQELYSDFNDNLAKYSLQDYYQSNPDNVSEEEVQQQYEEAYRNAILAIPNLSDDPEQRKLQQKAILGLYTDFYNDTEKNKLFKEDKNNTGYVYLDNFIIQNPNGMAGYYISFNPFTNSIKYNWIKDNADILNDLRAAFIKKREDARAIARTHFKVGGVIKMLGGGPTKQDSTYMYSMIGSGFAPKKLTITKKDPVAQAKEDLNKANEQVQKAEQQDAYGQEYVNITKEIDRKEAREAKIAGRNAKIDNWNYVAASNDLISLILSISNNPYVDAVATGAGLASSVERGIANVMDKSTPWYSDLGWFLADASAESLAMLPGWGTAAKLGKAKKAATTILNYLGTGAAVGTLAYLGVAERDRLGLALNKIINGDLKSLNTNDIEILTMALGSASSLGSKKISSTKQKKAIKNGEINEQTVTNNKKLGEGSFSSAAVRQSRKIGRGLDLEVTNSTQPTNNVTGERVKWLKGLRGQTKKEAAAVKAFQNRLTDADKMTQSTKLMDVFNKWTRYGGSPQELEELASQMLIHNKAVNEEEAILKIAEAINTYGSPRNVKYHLNSQFEAPEVVVTAPSKSKWGGKLNQLKALRKGGILKFQNPAGTLPTKEWDPNNEEFKEFVVQAGVKANPIYYEHFYNLKTANPNASIEQLVANFDSAEYQKNQTTGSTSQETLNTTKLPFDGNELKYFQSRGINPNQYGSVSEFRNSEEYVNYMNSPFNTKTNNQGKPTLASWRDTGSQKYFDGTNYTNAAIKDGLNALTKMDPSKRQAGLEALRDAGNNVEAWNQAFSTHFGDINKNIVGYNAEVDNFDGVSTQFRQNLIKNFSDFTTEGEDSDVDPVSDEILAQINAESEALHAENPNLAAEIKALRNPKEESFEDALQTYKRNAEGKRSDVGGEDQYKKVSGLYDLAQLGIKNDAIADYAKEMSDLYQDNVFRPTAHQIQAPKVTNLFEQRMLKQQQDAQDFFKVGQNLAALNPDQYRQQMLGLVSSQANSNMQFNMQERAHLDQQYQNLAEVDNTNAKARLDASQEGLKNQLSANVTTGTMLAEANKAIQNNWGDYMTQLKLNQQQHVKDWNTALYANEVDEAELNYQNAVNYANLHFANDPKAWQEHVNKAANALATLKSEQRNKMYGFKTKQTGPNFDVLSAKKGGKLDSETKLQIENSRFLSKQIIQQLKSRDKGLDRLSKITYKTILKSLGLE